MDSLFHVIPLLIVTSVSGNTCESGSQIPWSNRQKQNPCKGKLGDECEYSCYDGYVKIGRHVCQSYTTKSGTVVLDEQFFGGRCERLCESSAAGCSNDSVPVRWNASDSKGPCFQTTCSSPDDALRRLARGNYRLWRLGRSDKTGIYTGGVNPSASAADQSRQAHIGINGVALMMECVAVEMNWTSVEEAQARVNQSMTSLAGKTPGFTLPRNKRGWIPTFFDRDTGSSKMTSYTVLDTGLNAAGVLFAKKYFSDKHSDASLTKGISQLADEIWNAVEWDNLLCDADTKKISANGTAIPFTYDDDDNCAGLHLPLEDGFYEFSELHYTVWLAYGKACAGKAVGMCQNKALDRMWQAWQGRRNQPNHAFNGIPLLSLWSSYIVQLPYYASHSFNADVTWQKRFEQHFLADVAYFQSSAMYAGRDGQYGVGAGFTDKWCSVKSSGYEADMVVLNSDPSKGAQGCKIYSPYSAAGYLPASSDRIKSDLLELLAAGETTFPLQDGSGDFIMLRKSLLEPGWNQNTDVSMVDFSSELFGLSTLWLHAGFWQKYTDHFNEGIDTVIV